MRACLNRARVSLHFFCMQYRYKFVFEVFFLLTIVLIAKSLGHVGFAVQ